MSTRRLSSGLRIGTAADDASGLAVRELMRSDVSTLNQGVRNANDAISMIQTADGALEVIDEKLIRMKELAEQAATGTYTSDQRMIISSEFQAMASEIQRIAVATDFNGIKLLDNSLANATGAWGWSNPFTQAAHNGTSLDSTGPAKIHFGTGNSSAEDYYYVGVSNSQVGAILEPNQYDPNSEFQINQYTNNDQRMSDVTGLADGKLLVSWSSNTQDGSANGVVGRLFNSDGTPCADEFIINENHNSDQGNPSVSPLANGGFAVSWQSYDEDGNSWGTYAKVYNATGEIVKPEFLVNTTTTGDQSQPSITGLSNGNIVVAWHSEQDGSSFGVYGQMYTQAGDKVGSEFQMNTTTADFQQDPSVSGLVDGGFVAIWHSNNQDGSSWGVYGQRYNSNGAKIGDEFQVNEFTQNMQRMGYNRNVVGLNDGGFVTTWHSLNQDGSGWGIYGQQYGKDGSRVGGEFRVNDTVVGNQSNPTITNTPTGGFAVTWQSENVDASGYAIMYKAFDSNGVEVSKEQLVDEYEVGDQIEPSIGSLTDGSLVVTWSSNNQDGSGYGVYGRVLRPTFSVDNQQKAQNYLDKLSDAAVRVNANRANLGATQNRLENTISNLQIQAENLQDAESQISDVDVAEEMTNFVKEQILSQAATAMLAQANSIPKMAIQLISGG
uniref:Flagellin n=1 Tax=Desulfovibrio sp. U5L TaxID=596152 RepID=I2Q6J8_9BACT